MNINRLLSSPEEFGITKYTWNDQGLLDCFQSVSLRNKNLTDLPFNFGEIEGNFLCHQNQLSSLKGSPKIVKGNFICSNNNLTTLKDGPQLVKGLYDCQKNKISSLEGCPQMLTSLNVSENPLTTYLGISEHIEESFIALDTNIKKIDVFPKNSPKLFYCSLGKFKLKMDQEEYMEYVKRFNPNNS